MKPQKRCSMISTATDEQCYNELHAMTSLYYIILLMPDTWYRLLYAWATGIARYISLIFFNCISLVHAFPVQFWTSNNVI